MATRTIDIIGQRFGRLVVLRLFERRKSRRYFLCKCDCGTDHIARIEDLRRDIRSCGCLKKIRGIRIRIRKKRTRAYGIWIGIKSRIFNRKCKDFKNYGGAGLNMQLDWINSFVTFLADMGEPPPGTSIDRIDNTIGYFKENCRWATYSQQNKNRRSWSRLKRS